MKILFVLALIVVLSILSCLIWMLGKVSSTSELLFDHEVGSYCFRIPRNYMWSFESLGQGKVSMPNLHTLYPDMVGYSKANRDTFETLGWGGGALIRFIVKEKQLRDPVDNISERRKKRSNFVRKEVIEGETVDVYLNDAVMREYYFGMSENDWLLSCSSDANEKVKYPHCEIEFDYNENVIVRASYSKYLRQETSRVVERAKSLLQSFECEI